MQIQIHKTLRYLLAGGVGAFINFTIYFVLLRIFNVWYILASIISFLLSILAGFFLQKYFTFQNISKENIKAQMTYYFIFSLVNLFINLILLSFFVEILSIDKIFAKVLTLAILAIWSFFIYQNYIFKQSDFPFSG